MRSDCKDEDWIYQTLRARIAELEGNEELENIRRTADRGLNLALREPRWLGEPFVDLFQHILDIYGRIAQPEDKQDA
jgi:hypothetical protein